MFAYTAYGLRIVSALELPELVPAPPGAAGDLSIHSGTVDRTPAGDRADSICPWAGPGEVCLHYSGIATLLIRGGRDIILDASPHADPRVVRLILLGPALGVLLHQRSFLVLHASAVLVGGKGVAFIGQKGAGKSTTAAAFASAGHPLLADDVVAVAPETFQIYPAFPQMKLWPEAAAFFTAQSQDLPRLSPDLDKVGLRLADRFATQPAPLHRVFALQDGDPLAIQPFPPQQAFMQIVTHSYALPLLRPTGSASSHFHQAVALTSKIPVQKLVRPRHLPALAQLVAMVVADAA